MRILSGRRLWRWLIWLLVFVALGEISCRIFLSDALEVPENERSLAYQYDDTLGWFPKANSSLSFTASRPILAQHNSDGFRDVEHGPKRKPRMLILGDSFVWGYDVEAAERFTDKLQAMVPSWEIMNMGVSGYGTDQQFLLLQRWMQDYDPDFVFLVYDATSDKNDNALNMNYGPYYKPYYIEENGRLQLQGVPVPKGFGFYLAEHRTLCQSYFVRACFKLWTRMVNPEPGEFLYRSESLVLAFKNYVESRGVQFGLGFTTVSKEGFEDRFCKQHGIRAVNLETDLRYPEMGRHWTPEGHDFVAERMHRYMRGHLLIK